MMRSSHLTSEMSSQKPAPILAFRDVYVDFHNDVRTHSQTVHAVQGVSFDLFSGELLGLVGESGSGKSVSAFAALRLLPASARVRGQILLDAVDLLQLPLASMQKIRGQRVSMIFQEPTHALNPLHTLYKQVREAILVHAPQLSEADVKERVRQLLVQVDFAEGNDRWDAYPHELSGGQQQRVMIAMALAHEPDVLIADEPTTALDVTTQFQILQLLKRLQRERHMSMLLITHNLDVIKACADRVCVLEKGRVVETADTAQLFAAPQHPYTQRLLAARFLPNWHTVEDKAKPIANQHPLLQAQQVSVTFTRPAWIARNRIEKRVVDGVSFDLLPGETVGLVGESGSGKTTLAMAVLALRAHTGHIFFEGSDLAIATARQLRQLRSRLQVVFQDPFGSLNPRLTIEHVVGEGLNVHQPELLVEQRLEAITKALASVGLPEDTLHRYPHEFSGGQRQRIALARAVVLKPRLLVLDEPTSALDASTQREVLDLLHRLQRDLGMTYLLISHDFHVIRAACHRVMVMRGGKIVEVGAAGDIFASPRDPYTQELIRAAFLQVDESGRG